MTDPVPPDEAVVRLQSLFREALSKYRSETEVDLATHPLAHKLKDCLTVDATVTVFQGELNDIKDRKKQRLLEALKPTVEIMLALVDNGGPVAGIVGSIYPPGGAILGSIGIILRAMKKVGADYDGIIDIYNSIARFLERLRVYISVSTPHLWEVLVKTIAELLSISSTITKWVQQGLLKTFRKAFMGSTEITDALKRLDKLTNEELSMAVAEILRVIRNVSRDVSTVKGGLTEIQRNELKRRFRDWLSPPNPMTNHHEARSVRHRGSATWLIQGETFKKWKLEGTLLWIHGKVGSGKTVLCSAIIDDLWPIVKTESASVAYFYCDFQDPAKQDVHGILLSFLIQLCEQSDTYLNILSGLSSSFPEGSPKPGDDTLVDWLKYMLALPGGGIKYIIIDALDECPSSGLPTPRAGVMRVFQELCELSQTHNLRLCIMSRFEHDIRSVLEPLASHSMSLEEQRGQMKAMEDYTSSSIDSDSQMGSWDTETKSLVARVLSEKAHGMFRYVHCELETLRDCLPADIQDALDSLPENLEGTYERMLQRIPETKWKYAHHLFQCLAFSARPLSVAEAAEILVIDFDTDPIPILRSERRLSDPEVAIMSTCSTLVVVVSGDRPSSRMVQFAHMSVQDYLTSDRLSQSVSDRVSRYHVIPDIAHSLLAQVCLSTIIFGGRKDPDGDGTPESPLHHYSDLYWTTHVQFNGVSPRIAIALTYFLDPQRPGFDGWAKRTPLYDFPDSKSMDVRLICDNCDDHTSFTRSPLYHAAFLGLHQFVDHLAKSSPQHLNAPHGKSGTFTALHTASYNDHLNVVRLLLDCGAGIDASTGRGTTALHIASQNGHMEVVRLLLDRGANIDAAENDGTTALYIASQDGHLEVVQLLLDRGASIDAAKNNGGTALHIASLNGHLEIVRLLLDRGASIGAAENNGGGTALHIASLNGHLEVVRLLLDRGASIDASTGRNATALHIESQKGHLEVVRLLLDRGASIDASMCSGATALYIASRKGHLEVVRLLLDCGASIDAAKNDGATALHRASQEGHLEVVQLLLDYGASIDASMGSGATAIHIASQNGHLEVVRLLLKNGADIRRRGAGGKTAMDLASKKGFTEIVSFLSG